MKHHHLTLFAAGALALVVPAQAALLAYEGFDYAADTDLSGQNGGAGWTNAWSVTTGDSNVLGSLTYTDGSGNVLTTTGNSGYFTPLAGAANVQSRRTNSFVRDDLFATTWVSFIAAYGGNDLNRAAGFQLHTNTTERLSIGKGTTNVLAPGTWSILRGGSAATSVFTTNVITNVTFLVLRIDHQAGANDDVFLFANPALNGEPSTNDAAASMIGLAEYSFNAVRVFAAYSSGNYADYRLDEIRVGETYADVTPHASTPPATSLVITNTRLSGASLILSGQGGTSGGSYELLGQSDVTTSASTWPAISTNLFDASGTFSVTQAVQPGNRFFRVRTLSP